MPKLSFDRETVNQALVAATGAAGGVALGLTGDEDRIEAELKRQDFLAVTETDQMPGLYEFTDPSFITIPGLFERLVSSTLVTGGVQGPTTSFTYRFPAIDPDDTASETVRTMVRESAIEAGIPRPFTIRLEESNFPPEGQPEPSLHAHVQYGDTNAGLGSEAEPIGDLTPVTIVRRFALLRDEFTDRFTNR